MEFEESRSKAWCQTNSGIAFELLSPSVEMVHIEDIAHHLSRIARYSGATIGITGYSVAQHSVLCADLIRTWGGDAALQREALLHDAGEAYYGDITHPVQVAMREHYQRVIAWAAEQVGVSFAASATTGTDTGIAQVVEHAVEAALEEMLKLLAPLDPLHELKATVDPVVRSALGLAPAEPALVKRADMVALAIEKKLVMAPCSRRWELPELADTRWTALSPLPASGACEQFERRLEEIDQEIARPVAASPPAID